MICRVEGRRYPVAFPVRTNIQAPGYPDGIEIYGTLHAVDVAKYLKISVHQLFECFSQWGETGYPAHFRKMVGKGTNKDGSTYPVYLLIWNWQPKGKYINTMGSIIVQRKWGKAKNGKDIYRDVCGERVVYRLMPST